MKPLRLAPPRKSRGHHHSLGRALAVVLITCWVITSIGPLGRPRASTGAGRASAPGWVSPPAGAPSEANAAARARAREALGKLPLYFVENRGQLDNRVAYYLQGSDKTIYFTPEGLTFALRGPDKKASGEPAAAMLGGLRPAAFGREAGRAGRGWALKLDFIGARPGVRPVGRDQTEAVFSYFRGPREQWRTGLKTYAGVVYPDLWPGIDLVYEGAGDRLKYSFVVKPGADPGRIRLAYRGASEVKVTREGQLEVKTPAGNMSDERPVSYQEVSGRRVEVASGYELEAGAKTGARAYGFRLGEYDRSRELVIDPAMVIYAGYIGGSGFAEGNAIAVDSAGNAYVTGRTDSDQSSFPVAVGPDLSFNSGGAFEPMDAFVAKVRADGTGLLYCGYIGGSKADIGLGIAVDTAGSAYVIGITQSDQSSFPVTVGPDLSYNGGGIDFDAFVAKVRADGTGLLYCGYIGGTGNDFGSGIAVDSAGNAYVTGATSSTQSSFPVAVGPDLSFNGGSGFDDDAFVAKVRADGTGLLYCGYIGGGSIDRGSGIAVDSAGNAYITGSTSSDQASFPVAVGPDLSYNRFDAFVAKVRADGTGLLYCGYIGGSGDDLGQGIAVDSAGNAYVTGATSSDQSSFPVTVGPDLSYNGSPLSFTSADAFVAKVRADGTGLLYCGYIGGSGQDFGYGIAVDTVGNAYITGSTQSDQSSFPVAVGPDLSFNGGGVDAFVAKVRADGAGLLYCGYIGGRSAEFPRGIAVDLAGNAYITGYTESDQSSFPVTVGPDLSFNGGRDAFVVKIGEPATDAGADLLLTKTASPEPVAAGALLTYTLTLTNRGPSPAQSVTLADALPDHTAFVSCVAAGGGVCGGSGRDRTVSFTSLAPGASATVTLVARVNCSAAGGAVIRNQAAVSSATPDPDPSNNSAGVASTVSNPPPVITGAVATPDVLWPPNHKMVDVTVNYAATGNCGAPTCTLSVSSNEPADGQDDGHTGPDWEVVDAHHVRLRSERAGGGIGRVYTITISCRDSAGGAVSRAVTVIVPHSKGKG